MAERADNTVLDSRGRARVQTVNTLKSETRQSDAKKGDINHILKKYDLGLAQHLRDVDAVFMDVSEHTDYADMARTVAAAETQFMQLPSKVREIFNHNVHEWLDAAHATEAEKNALLAAAGVDGFTVPDPSGGSETDATGASAEQITESGSVFE